jgi:GNAT superfamily N-acetyltransferase
VSKELSATDQPQTGPTFQIRPARPGDLPALSSLTVRLAEFPIPTWRTGAQVIDAERAAVTQALAAGSPDAPIFVAEDKAGRVFGFAYLETHQDYFTGRFHAHVSILVVAGTAEGRGVGQALLAAAEAWDRERGDPFITLNVFAQNVRARALYERLGYGAETLRYVKPLDSADAG